MRNETYSLDLKKEDILHKFSLKFKNKKYQEEFEITYKQSNKKFRLIYLTLGLIISILILIWSIVIKNTITSKFVEDNINQQKLKENEKLILQNSKNDLDTYIYFEIYILVNQTAMKENNFTCNFTNFISKMDKDNFNLTKWAENNLIPTTNLFYSTLYFFDIIFQNVWIISLCLVCLQIFIFIIYYRTENIKISEFYFVILSVIFGLNFHVLVIISTYYVPYKTEPIFFIVAIDLLYQIYFTLNMKSGWLVTSITNLLSLIFEWGLIISIFQDNLSNSIFLYYLAVNSLVHIILILLSYKNEIAFKNTFYLLYKMKLEKNYIMNLVENTNQGYFCYCPIIKKITFSNKSMLKIFEEFKQILIKMGIENFNKNLNSANSFKILMSHENLITLNNNEVLNDAENKLILEHILNNFLINFNEDLPKDILIKIKENSINFKLDEFINLLNIKEETNLNSDFNFKEFNLLGKLNIKNRILDLKEKSYQILFRIIYIDENEKYLEFMFSDVSKLLLEERENTLISARSLYLSKIAHEFKNPLSALMEMAHNIKEELNNYKNSISNISNKTNLDNILISKINDKIYPAIDYSEKIYKILINFLKDFSLFSNLKFPCESSNKICEKVYECQTCRTKHLCKLCQICKTCENNNNSYFDFVEVLKDKILTFNLMSTYENRNLKFIYTNEDSFPVNNNLNLIKTNKEFFRSIIFNLLYHTFKSSYINNEIKIKTQILEEGKQFYFEVENKGFEVEENFIKILNLNNKPFFEDDNENYLSLGQEESQDSKSNKFIKYFGIYVSFFMLKKISSNLVIENSKNCCKFYFIINFEKFKENLLKNDINNKNINQDISFENLSQNEITLKIEKSFKFNYKQIKSCNFNDKNNNCDFNDKNNNCNVLEVKSEIKSKNLKNKILRFLIIDDEKFIRSSIIRHFKKIEKLFIKDSIEFEIYEAEDCFQSLNILYKNLQENKHFDILIIDEHMPLMKGSTLIKLLKQLNNENNFYKMTLISHTAFDSKEKKKFILDSGADFILSKPVEFEDFKELILNLII